MPADWVGERPLYEVKANLFKGLAHPVRIRVLELLADVWVAPGRSGGAGNDGAGDECGQANVGGRDKSGGPGELAVTALLAETGLEASHLSQHLAVLRNNHLVLAERRGSQVFYRLAYAQVGDLLVIARDLLGAVLRTNQMTLALASASAAVVSPVVDTVAAAASHA